MWRFELKGELMKGVSGGVVLGEVSKSLWNKDGNQCGTGIKGKVYINDEQDINQLFRRDHLL